MPLSAISIEGYRSVRKIRLPVDDLSVFVGGNGVGKTNLYNALALLQAAADGTLTRTIAAEGGVESVLWAGKRQHGKPVRLVLTAHFDSMQYGVEVGLPQSYEVEIGLRAPTEAAFPLEPLIKEERLTVRHRSRDIVMMERKRGVVTLRNADGARECHTDAVLSSETALTVFRDATRYPELETVRRELQDWRLYHDFRTDAASPIRKPCHAITTPTLSSDGHDLAAVLATLFVIREDTTDLDRAIEDAFPGASLSAADRGSWCQLGMSFAEMPKRVFGPHELSDGTLKYLCLLGALMGYRLPSLVALNEPEASLHPDLLPPLARLIANAARNTRVWIVTHSQVLADALHKEGRAQPRTVIKVDGATTVEGLRPWGEYVQRGEDDEGEG